MDSNDGLDQNKFESDPKKLKKPQIPFIEVEQNEGLEVVRETSSEYSDKKLNNSQDNFIERKNKELEKLSKNILDVMKKHKEDRSNRESPEEPLLKDNQFSENVEKNSDESSEDSHHKEEDEKNFLEKENNVSDSLEHYLKDDHVYEKSSNDSLENISPEKNLLSQTPSQSYTTHSEGQNLDGKESSQSDHMNDEPTMQRATGPQVQEQKTDYLN